MTNSRRSIAALALLIAAASLAGCSSAQEATRPLAAAATSTSSSAPTKAQAAKIYLSAVGPANKATSKLNDALEAGNLKRIHATAKTCATANRQFLAVLTGTQWPAGTQKHADKLAEDAAVDQSVYTALTTAKTMSEVDDARAALSSGNSQAQLMRVKLGLEAVPAA